ncbi:MAG: HlyD family type I secretion periplasmic adaptor subunit [Candidatus Parcubacteria bacterium]|nr:HlyD family type I secretion periplasmic adaptor subunit [Burkholderiales bacterium]
MALFSRMAGWLEPVRKRIDPGLDQVLERVGEKQTAEDAGFVAEAEQAMMRQDPARARILIRVLLLVVVLFFVWAAVAPMEEIARGDGRVVPSKQLQILQSLDGGIVSEILVREGQIVSSGQTLLRVDSTRFVSSVKENRAQYLPLLAKAARLKALAEGLEFVPPPELPKEDPRLLAEELRLFQARRSELQSAIAVSQQQLAGKRHELTEAQAKREEASQALALSTRELTVTKPLASTGAVSEVELLRLERDVARFRGEGNQAAAQISRAQAAISEASHKIREVELNFRNEAGKELAETQAKLGQLTEGNVGLADRVKQSELKAPLRGTVKRLMVNTIGGVVQPGKDLVEIVPLDDSLLIEARIQPRDVAFLHPGQRAIVRLTAYDYSVYGGLEAAVEQIAADSVPDEKGNIYYLVRVRTKESSLGRNLPIIPGMVAEVDIVTGKKSFLAYMLKPILRAKHLAFSER